MQSTHIVARHLCNAFIVLGLAGCAGAADSAVNQTSADLRGGNDGGGSTQGKSGDDHGSKPDGGIGHGMSAAGHGGGMSAAGHGGGKSAAGHGGGKSAAGHGDEDGTTDEAAAGAGGAGGAGDNDKGADEGP